MGSIISDDPLEQAAQYSRDVLNGRIVVGQLATLAVERNERDLQDGGDRGLYFDEDAARRSLGFFAYLKHSKGDWAGQPIVLSPWQCFVIAVVFGWYKEDTGTRRFRTVYQEVARKNGKTTILAGVGLKGLTKDDEGGPEIYCAATKRDQAKIMFDEASRMVRQSPPLRRRLDIQNHAILYRKNFGKLIPLSADANSLDGLNPHVVLVDELHAHKTSELWDVLKSALGARSQPLHWAITTAGYNKDGICYEVRDYAIQVLQRLIDDDSFFVLIYTLDNADLVDWQNEANWIKANPNLGVSVSLNYLREQCRQAVVMPRARVNFCTKHLNIWMSGESQWCNVEAWARCAGVYRWNELAPADVSEVYLGLDLSSVSDITAIGGVAIMHSGQWRCFALSYLPEMAVKSDLRKSPVPFSDWHEKGWLTLTPGNVVDYEWIKADLRLLRQTFNVIEIAFDRWNSSQLVNDMMDEGAPMVAFGQGFGSMNAPMKELERRYLAGEIEHPNDPVLNWAMANVVSLEDPAGNVKPAKDRSKEKIDPAVALIMAVGRAMLIDGIVVIGENDAACRC